jgi:hypothetical protein
MPQDAGSKTRFDESTRVSVGLFELERLRADLAEAMEIVQYVAGIRGLYRWFVADDKMTDKARALVERRKGKACT